MRSCEVNSLPGTVCEVATGWRDSRAAARWRFGHGVGRAASRRPGRRQVRTRPGSESTELAGNRAAFCRHFNAGRLNGVLLAVADKLRSVDASGEGTTGENVDGIRISNMAIGF